MSGQDARIEAAMQVMFPNLPSPGDANYQHIVWRARHERMAAALAAADAAAAGEDRRCRKCRGTGYAIWDESWTRGRCDACDGSGESREER